jgi:hypothetical protein
MAIVNNTLSEIGDVLFVEAQANISGNVLALTSFSDTVIGETLSRYFYKQFRVSMNGVIFTDWKELTVPNLVGIEGLTGGIIYFQFAYTRDGSDNTGLLEFIEVNINGDIIAFVCTGITTHLSILNNYACSNVYTAELCNNLVKKLYERGIVPEYIIRGDGETDEDYVAFWSAIACYFSMFVSFAKDFDNIINKREWLLEYLSQKGMFLCADDVSLEDLQYLAGKFFEEISKRGTIEIIKPKGFVRADGTVVAVNGELLRLVCWSVCEEFLFALAKPHRVGWCMGQSSPMYRHTLYEEQLIKGYENTKDVIDLNQYPLINANYIDLLPSQDLPPSIGGVGQVMRVRVPLPVFIVGIGSFSGNNNAIKPITVSPYLDYEITAWIRVVGNPNNTEISFGANAYDCSGVSYNLQNVSPGINWDNYFDNSIKLPTNEWCFIRGIVYAFETQEFSSPDNQINLNLGNNLRFSFPEINQLVPRLAIKYNGVAVAEAQIWDFKVRPLRTDYSVGFLNTQNLLHIWAKNKNAKYSNEEQENNVRKFLVPYGTIPIHNWIGQKPAPGLANTFGYWTIQNEFKIVN